MSVLFPYPLRSDHGEDAIALAYLRFDMFPEVLTERDGIDVHEDGIVTEVCTQTIIDPPGNPGRILPPIGEENLGHRALELCVLRHRFACTRLISKIAGLDSGNNESAVHEGWCPPPKARSSPSFLAQHTAPRTTPTASDVYNACPCPFCPLKSPTPRCTRVASYISTTIARATASAV